MNIIVCNIGSSSFKFQLLDMPSEKQLARGSTERVGMKDAIITYWVAGKKVFDGTAAVPSHREAVQHALQFLTTSERSVLANLDDLDGVGFKTIQAGEKNISIRLCVSIDFSVDRHVPRKPRPLGRRASFGRLGALISPLPRLRRVPGPDRPPTRGRPP